MVNKVFLLGNLGKDPEVRFTSGGRAVCKFPLATGEKWTDRDGNRQERTEWSSIVVWGKQAESCGKYLSKGKKCFVEGSIRSRQYDDKDGVKRYITEIVAKDVRFLDFSGSGVKDGGSVDGAQSSGNNEPGGVDDSDEIPF